MGYLSGGHVSNRLGFRLALIVACLFGIAGRNVYRVTQAFWHVTGAEILLGVICSFISSSDTALLYETLLSRTRLEIQTL